VEQRSSDNELDDAVQLVIELESEEAAVRRLHTRAVRKLNIILKSQREREYAFWTKQAEPLLVEQGRLPPAPAPVAKTDELITDRALRERLGAGRGEDRTTP